MPVKVEKVENIAAKKVEIAGAKNTAIRVLISKADGAENFAMRLFEIAAGGNTPLHSHPHEHEVFVLEGDGVFVCQQQEHRISSETFILVPGEIEHQFKNNGKSILRFLCLVPSSAA
ncbi:MAG: cupin domain-containing protein [Phycisphaerae bacterium]